MAGESIPIFSSAARKANGNLYQHWSPTSAVASTSSDGAGHSGDGAIESVLGVKAVVV